MVASRSEQSATPMKDWADRSAEARGYLIVAVAVAYFLAARLGQTLSFATTNATPIMPSAGVAIAVVLALGWRVWPGVLLGAWTAHAIQLFSLPNISTGSVLLGATLMALGNTLECLAGRFALQKLGSVRPSSFDNGRDAFKFVLMAACVPVVAATLGLMGAVASGAWDGDKLALWQTWWLGDAAGIVVCAPAMLAWTRRVRLRWSPSRIVEAVLLSMALVLTGLILFGLPEPGIRSMPYLVMPLLFWVVLRFSVREATSAVVLVAAIATWGTVQGRGPFVSASVNQSLLLLQAFVATLAVTVLALSAALTQRRHLNQTLQQANASLQERVEEQTQKLSQANEQLSRQEEQRERFEQKMRRMAQHDSLTGLANQGLLEELFDAIEALARRHDSEMALLLIDVSSFEPPNQKALDQLLVTMASRLEASVRESDLVARTDGDQFVVVLSKLSTPQDAMGVAEKVLGVLAQPVCIEDETGEAEVRIGIARYPQDSQSFRGLLRCAAQAMAGKKGCALFGA